MDLIKKTNIDFVTKRNAFFMTSLIATVVGLIIAFLPGMIDLGIDFTGGTQISVSFANKSASADQVRSAVRGIGYGGAEIKSFGKDGDYLIRINQTGQSSTVSAKIVAGLQSAFPSDNVVLLGADNVDPKVSSELAFDSALSLFIATIIILIYVAFRFQLAYGISAVVALAHDVLMAFVISVLFNKLGILNLELSINSLAAYLTILGYSINDKVVVFDRIREMFRNTSKLTPAEVVDRSINTTLSRTIMTALTTALAMLGLFLFGGPSVENFALVMLIGIVVGTLSSIMFAAQLLLLLGVNKRDLMPKARDLTELERRP